MFPHSYFQILVYMIGHKEKRRGQSLKPNRVVKKKFCKNVIFLYRIPEGIDFFFMSFFFFFFPSVAEEEKKITLLFHPGHQLLTITRTREHFCFFVSLVHPLESHQPRKEGERFLFLFKFWFASLLSLFSSLSDPICSLFSLCKM